MTDVKEIGDSYAVAARAAVHLGRFREAEAHASACIERARGIDSGSYLHGLTWRVAARFTLGEWEARSPTRRSSSASPRSARESCRPPSRWARTRASPSATSCGASPTRRIGTSSWRSATSRSRLRHAHAGGSIHLPPLALALARRGRFDEALALIPLVPRSLSAGATLEALCEIAAVRERWDEAAALVAAAREEAEVGEQLTLPLFADRLEGRAAAAASGVERAAELLSRSADGFAALGARWEEAWSRLLLAEAVAGSDSAACRAGARRRASRLRGLGSVREAERARALLDLGLTRAR